MRFLLTITLSILFIACVPKVNKINSIQKDKINKELLNSINTYKSENIELYTKWWEEFKDPQLNHLINQAFNNGFTIKQLEEKLKISQARIKSQQSDDKVNIDLNSSTKKERFSENNLTPATLKGTNVKSYNNNLALNYNFDFWDERASLIKALKNEALAQKVLIQVKKLYISTNIAKLYIQWNSQSKKIEELQRIKKELLEKQHILKQLFAFGLSNEKKINLNKYEIKKLKQNIIKQKEQIEQVKNAINLLCDLSPKELNSLNKPNISLNKKTYIPKTINLDILSHIPKIAVQKYLLKSKENYIKKAEAKFYPNINLKAFLNFSSISFANAFEQSSSAPNATLALNLPIFDANKRKENLNIKTFEYNQQVYVYNKTIIDSASKIVTTLKKINLNKKSINLQKNLKKDKKKNIKIEEETYKLGLKNKLTLLDLQMDLRQETLRSIDLKNKKLTLQIDLYEALGGGFKNKVLKDASIK